MRWLPGIRYPVLLIAIHHHLIHFAHDVGDTGRCHHAVEVILDPELVVQHRLHERRLFNTAVLPRIDNDLQ